MSVRMVVSLKRKRKKRERNEEDLLRFSELRVHHQLNGLVADLDNVIDFAQHGAEHLSLLKSSGKRRNNEKPIQKR